VSEEKNERQASDEEERETGRLWRRARDTRVIEQSERQASDGGEQETGE
jgi:hypothetical protein